MRLLADRQRSQEHALNQREHHGCPGDAQPQRKDGCSAEGFRPVQSPPRETDIVLQVLEDHAGLHSNAAGEVRSRGCCHPRKCHAKSVP